MKRVDVRSMVIGMLLVVMGIVFIAATTGNRSGYGKFELFAYDAKDYGLGATLLRNGSVADEVALTGIFKIDTDSGQVWALSKKKSVEKNLISGWVSL